MNVFYMGRGFDLINSFNNVDEEIITYNAIIKSRITIAYGYYVVKQLANKGIVEYVNTGNLRNKTIRLTDKGKELLLLIKNVRNLI